MTLEVFGAIATITPLIALLVALAAIRIGLGGPGRARAAAWTCVATVLVVIVLGIATYLAAMATVYADLVQVDASSKASALAAGISEALNGAALIALGTLPPAIAAVYLFVRARRKRDQPQVAPG